MTQQSVSQEKPSAQLSDGTLSECFDWFESALDYALLAQATEDKLKSLLAPYNAARERFENYIYRGGPRAELPEFPRLDWEIHYQAAQVFSERADDRWQRMRETAEFA